MIEETKAPEAKPDQLKKPPVNLETIDEGRKEQALDYLARIAHALEMLAGL